MRISANGAFAYVDYVIAIEKGQGRREALVYSCFDRSEIALRSFTANISLNNAALYMEEAEGKNEILMFPRMDADSYHTKMVRGKEPLNHAVSVSKHINEKYLVTTVETRDRDIYNYLMTNFDLPLLVEWVPYFLSAGRECIRPMTPVFFGNPPEWARDLKVYEVCLEEAGLQEMVSNGLAGGMIRIAESKQEPLSFDNMDDYFMKYGSSLIKNLEKKLNPLVELKETVDEIAFLEKRFFPQQAAIVNGLMECMKHSSYAFLNEDMGCGKTLQGMGVLEGFFNRMMVERSGRTIKDVYSDQDAVKYRNIIMCPSHLVEKWAEAIRADIPYAKVTIIRSIKELCRLRKRGKERTAKEFYVMSKETGKLSYTYEPLPTQVKSRRAMARFCRRCGAPRPMTLPKQCACGGTEWELRDCGFTACGMVCPECGLLLYPSDAEMLYPSADKPPLQPSDFATQTRANRICRNCGTPLWQPACEPVNRTLTFQPVKVQRKKWVKMTHWANKAKKNKKTVWVHERWKESYIAENDIDEEEVVYPKVTGVRKFAPSRYIRKYLKGYFDFAIFDEAHEYKGGGSAQGLAMHDLVSASRWQLALTGTIAGGYASHFFYLLYRLDPAKMKRLGYTYGSEGEKKFVGQYGTIATEYEVSQENEGSYNSMSRGRQLGSPKCRPGISLRIFTDFLLDKAVFLNLTDMSSYLPPLIETIEYVPLEDEIFSSYNMVRAALKKAMMEQSLGKSILGTFLQFSLSYTDKPYGRADILSPVDGSLVAQVPDLSHLVEGGRLLNKEKRLCELIRQEIAEDRNVFVYCEYTGDGEANVTKRLRKVIRENCGLRAKEVEILESSHPSAEEREMWMHEMASKGVRVFITNPKCVKTGLDFLFYHREVMYNFPTIIFYQYSYDLFTMWQASRRHYRLNQVLECRTFYLLSDRTIQMDALEMVASKQVATSAIQGHFSSEGLCAMAQGVDPRIKLAQAAAEKSPEQIKGLKSMFDVLNQWHAGSKEKAEHRQMMTFFELTGIDLKLERSRQGSFYTESGETVDLFALFGAPGEEDTPVEAEESKESAGIPDILLSMNAEGVKEPEREERMPEAAGAEMSFFGFFGAAGELSGLFRNQGTTRRQAKSGSMKKLLDI